MEINEIEMAEIQTHIKLVNKSYMKMQQQRGIVQNLEEEFQVFFKELVEKKGGDPEKEYQLDLENGLIIEAQTQEQVDTRNNGSQPQPQAPTKKTRARKAKPSGGISPISEEVEFSVDKADKV